MSGSSSRDRRSFRLRLLPDLEPPLQDRPRTDVDRRRRHVPLQVRLRCDGDWPATDYGALQFPAHDQTVALEAVAKYDPGRLHRHVPDRLDHPSRLVVLDLDVLDLQGLAAVLARDRHGLPPHFLRLAAVEAGDRDAISWNRHVLRFDGRHRLLERDGEQPRAASSPAHRPRTHTRRAARPGAMAAPAARIARVTRAS